MLIEREWLDFGHKFAERLGVFEGAADECAPIFLQFLDAVNQLRRMYPKAFEFTEGFLLRLIQHVFSCQYGTFFCNSSKERSEKNVSQCTASVWSLLHESRSCFKNPMYEKHDYAVSIACFISVSTHNSRLQTYLLLSSCWTFRAP